MPDRLKRLAANHDSDSRRDLLRSVADMFYADGRDHIVESEMRLFALVVTRVLKDMSEADRSAFSGRVAADQRTPLPVALGLANDTVEVATPMIEQSPLLTDDDLIDIANRHGLDHRLAISRRPNINERVTDVLVDFDETEVMSSILANDTAKTSERALNKIADRALTVQSLRDQLSFRQNTPAAVLQRLLPHLGDTAQDDARAILAKGGAGLDVIAARAETLMVLEKGSTARRRLQIKALAARVSAGEMSINGFVGDCLSAGRPLDLALALSCVSQLPEKQVANAVLATDVQPLNFLCKALDLDIDTYAHVDATRRASVRLSSQVPKSVLDDYAALDMAAARRAMRFVKLHNGVSSAG